MEESQTELCNEEIQSIVGKINRAIDCEQFEEAEKWIKSLKSANVPCETLEKKVAIFRVPEPYYGEIEYNDSVRVCPKGIFLFGKLFVFVPMILIFLHYKTISKIRACSSINTCMNDGTYLAVTRDIALAFLMIIFGFWVIRQLKRKL
jgi:hypothetical protein